MKYQHSVGLLAVLSILVVVLAAPLHRPRGLRRFK